MSLSLRFYRVDSLDGHGTNGLRRIGRFTNRPYGGGGPAWCYAIRWCVNIRCMPECVIPVGAFRETPAGYVVCRPGVEGCRGVWIPVCGVRTWAFHEPPLRRRGRPGVARCHDAMPDRVGRMRHSRRGVSRNARRIRHLPARRCGMRRCMHARLRRVVVGVSRTAPTEARPARCRAMPRCNARSRYAYVSFP